MSNGDYGYFGKGDTGYAQYVAAETTTTMAVAAGTVAGAAASSLSRWWSCWCSSPWEAEGIPTV